MMTQREQPVDRIRKAHNLVARAEECWNAGSLAAVEACLATLEESAVELRAAQAIAMGRPDSLPGLRNEILQMKEKVIRIESLSDLAAAFLRRSRQSTGDSPMYRAGGFEDNDHSLAPTTRIQA
jgi:hypothetical protein